MEPQINYAVNFVPVDRHDANASLVAAFESANKGNGSIAFLSGEVGVGKTTLIRSFLEKTKKEIPDVLVAESRCTSLTGENDAYHPFQKIFSSLICQPVNGIRGNKNIKLFLKIAPTWLSMIPSVGGAIAAIVKTVSEVNEAHLPRDCSQKEINIQFLKTIEGLQKKHLVIIVIEDLQWIDKSSINLLFEISKIIEHFRIFIICSYRTSDVALASHDINQNLQDLICETLMHECAKEIILSPFSIEQTQELLSNYFPQNNFPDDLLEKLYARSGGNPFFINQIIRLLVSEGKLFFNKQSWFYSGDSLDKIPGGAKGIILKRIERLPNELRNIIDVASVDGYYFTGLPVQRIVESEFGISPKDFFKDIESLEHVYGVIVRKEEMELNELKDIEIYRFSHGLIQESIYGSLPDVVRQKYHKRMGDELLRLYGLENENILSRVAIHYKLANDFSNALQYFFMAGKQSEKIFATEEAVNNYSEALNLIEEDALVCEKRFLIDLYISLADQVANQMGQFDQAIDLYRKAAVASHEIEQIELYIKCLHMEGVCLKNLGMKDDALEIYQQAIKLARKNSLFEREGNILRDTGKIFIESGDYNKAIEILHSSWALLETTNNYFAQAASKCFLGQAFRENGDYVNARRHLFDAIEIYRKNGFNLRLLLSIYAQISLLAYQEENIDEGARYSKMAIRLGKEHAFYHQLSEFYLQLASLYMKTNKISKVSDAFGNAAYFGYKANSYQHSKALDAVKRTIDALIYEQKHNIARHLCDGIIKFGQLVEEKRWGMDFSQRCEEMISATKS